jgi:CRISPR-associated protein Csm3
MKQIGVKIIKGSIVVRTGLHIGAGNDKIEIGGMDMPVIKNPVTDEPFIPGSSIKGKLRSLIEWKENKIDATGGKPCYCGKWDCCVCRVFGVANSGNKSEEKEKARKRGPTRLIIRDADLSDKSRMEFKGISFFEDKIENGLNRVTAEAMPRHIERVVPGVEFNFELVYRVIDTGDEGKKDEEYFASVVKEGLILLQNDYLGGGGSRGNGRIKFNDLKDENGKAIDL